VPPKPAGIATGCASLPIYPENGRFAIGGRHYRRRRWRA
jgi:hypothetical protein